MINFVTVSYYNIHFPSCHCCGKEIMADH